MKDRTWGYLLVAVVLYAVTVVVITSLVMKSTGPICWEPVYAPGTVHCLDPANDERRR